MLRSQIWSSERTLSLPALGRRCAAPLPESRRVGDLRRMIKYVHPVAGGLATLTIATFWFP